MKQTTLSAGSFDCYAKTTQRAAFRADMDRVVPWSTLCTLIEPFYPKAGNGRPPVGLECMLRIYFLRNWFNLSDLAVEEALYDSLSMREFVSIDLGREAAPDETTACKFRHLLEANELGKRLLEEVGRHLQSKGMRVSTGTIIDATIINAPSLTQNRSKVRDPAQRWVQKMHQTKKSTQWYFLNPSLEGMKAHLGVDSKTKVIHSIVATAANEHDKHTLPQLLHGNERGVYGDSAYSSQKTLIAQATAQGARLHQSEGIPQQRIEREGTKEELLEVECACKVEHAFLIIKRIFGFAKVSYRGMMKNGNRLFVVSALANLLMARHHLLQLPQERCP